MRWSRSQTTTTLTLYRCASSSSSLALRFRFLLRQCARATALRPGKQLHAAATVTGLLSSPNLFLRNALLHLYASCSLPSHARKLFDEIPHSHKDSVDYTALIRRCSPLESLQLFLQMRQLGLPLDGVAMVCALNACARLGDPRVGTEMHVGVVKFGFLKYTKVCNAVMNVYVKFGLVGEARKVFEEIEVPSVVSWTVVLEGVVKWEGVESGRLVFDGMPERNVVSWSAMIDGYMEKGLFEEGFCLFLDMRREGVVGVNSTTMTIMLKGCGSCGGVREGMQVHGLVSRMGFEFDSVLSNSIITMYSLFGCTDMAEKVFSAMSNRDVVTWNSLISGYVYNNEVDVAYGVFERMPEKDLISWTAMITGFAKSGRVGKAIELFDMLREKDDFVWTAVISGFVSNKEYEEALRWYARLNWEGCRPNPLTISSVLAASAALVALNEGLQIHACVLKKNLECDLSVQNSLVSFYAKCGNVIGAYRVFMDVVEPNVISYNSIINGFAQNGFAEEALSVYKRMQCEGHEPNHVTFLAVLSACTHAGLVEEGWNLFNTMKSRYQIEPEADHYACMVDLLGRAGLLDEAIDLIRSMPLKPHSGVWGAILGASKTHLRLDLAELAAQHIAELEPANATPYVVLSNLYSSFGKKMDGDLVRKTKHLKGIKKVPGCSTLL